MDLLDPRDILAAARRLPRKAQTDLAEALLRGETGAAATPSLEPLHGLSDNELRTLADAILAPGHQRRLKTLLRKSREGRLRADEPAELEALLEEIDRIALLKARAAFTLTRSDPSGKRAS